MNISIIQKNKRLSVVSEHVDQRGFAMLFTVLIVSLILSIALGISNITLKQTILSSLAKDSQVAFYQADTAVECGMYYDLADRFPLGSDPGSVAQEITCGNDGFKIDESQSFRDYLVFIQNTSNQVPPCSSIVFDKVTNAGTNEAIVQGLGYNTCAVSPRQVQRALQVTYSLTP